MKYSEAFSYVFDDSNWFKKILIAGLIFLIPIVGQLYLLGWMIEIARRVKAGRETILPTTHFGYFLTLGLKAFLVSLVYSIPLILVNIFLRTVGAAAVSSETSNTASFFFMSMSCFGSFFSLLFSIVSGIGSLYGYCRLAETDEISAAINISDAWSTIKTNWQPYLLVFLLEIVTSIIGALGFVICIGFILTAPYAVAVNGHLLGQLNLNAVTPARKEHAPRNAAPSVDNVEEAPLKTAKSESAVEEKAAEAAATVSEAVSSAAEEAAEKAEVIEGTFKELRDEAADKAEEIHDAVENKAEEVHDAVEDKAEEIHDAVEEKTEEIHDTVADKAEEIHDAVEDKAEEVKKDIDDKLNDLKDF